jgi:predicted O-linked N-acetylglucosamine transferase (SPINDLY family)
VVRRGLAGFSVLAGHERLKKADWRKRDALIRNFQGFIEADTARFALDAPEYLFLSYALEMPSACRARLAGKIATRLAREAGRNGELTKRCPSSPERIRLGYLAADFRCHPLFDVFLPILKLHDRQAFEIILFSTGPDDGSAERKRLIELADCFVDLQHLDDKARAARIAGESPDILVDLSGYTLHAAPQLLAQRLAPLQFSYAGFLCSQGAPWIDYTILDRQLLQEAERPWWTEQIIHAPVFPLVRPARAVELAAAEISPANGRPAELPAGQGFVFCAFHNTWKVNPRSFALWMQILQRSGHSVLWLLADEERVRRNYLEAAGEHGVDPARLCFAAPMPHREHLLRLRHADLFLDTVGCGAHTTAGEALVLWVPLLTHAGVAVHERYAASLLLDAGLPELVVDDEQAYIEVAVGLATDPARHLACRERVARSFSLAAVETHDRNCVHALEAAFTVAFSGYCRGDKPADRDLTG